MTRAERAGNRQQVRHGDEVGCGSHAHRIAILARQAMKGIAAMASVAQMLGAVVGGVLVGFLVNIARVRGLECMAHCRHGNPVIAEMNGSQAHLHGQNKDKQQQPESFHTFLL